MSLSTVTNTHHRRYTLLVVLGLSAFLAHLCVQRSKASKSTPCGEVAHYKRDAPLNERFPALDSTGRRVAAYHGELNFGLHTLPQPLGRPVSPKAGRTSHHQAYALGSEHLPQSKRKVRF